MVHILKRLTLLFTPIYLWFLFFVAFEPNNYFGLKGETDSSQPVARVRAYQQDPGQSLIIGDSRACAKVWILPTLFWIQGIK